MTGIFSTLPAIPPIYAKPLFSAPTGDPRDTNPLYFHTDYDYDLNKILDILDRHSNYNNSADYDQLPYWGEKNNCNSYTNTINDGEIPEFMRTNPLYPGINYIIDNKYFE